MKSPLSLVQKGLYVECMEHQGEICYNMSYLYTFSSSLNIERLKKAVEKAVANHPSLFTRIGLDEDGEPYQYIKEDERFDLSVEQIKDIELEKQRLVAPFDITRDRLFRIHLLQDDKGIYLALDIHHIIFDGASLKLLINDIEKAYNGEPVEKEQTPVSLIIEEETKKRQTPAFEEDKQWYAAHFDCGDCYSPLLPDRDGTKDVKNRQKTEKQLARTLKTNLAGIEAFCKKNGIYKSSLFTAAFSFMLAKINNEQQSLFETVYNGRGRGREAQTIAMLVKTIPVYAKFDDNSSVMDFIKAVQEQMTGCRQHETYAFSDMVADLGIQPAVIFAWHGNTFEKNLFCDKPCQIDLLCNNTRECPIYIKVNIKNEQCIVAAEYNSDDYSESLVGQYLETYEAILEGFLQCKNLKEVSTTTPEQLRLLDSFNQTDSPYDEKQTIVSLFRQQVAEHPGKTAVVFQNRSYTYREVDELSDKLAAFIHTKGLGEEDVVSILIPRSEWMAIASLGVIKAGCAYQPLDPTYPQERLNFMMQDANAKMLIADEQLRPLVAEYKGEVLTTQNIRTLPPANTKLPDPKPETLFNVLYTSGSTGVPKGCQWEHRTIVAFRHSARKGLMVDQDSIFSAYASYGFDASAMEVFVPLTSGCTVHIIPEEIRFDLIALADYYEKNNISHAFMTTQVAYQFATSVECKSLKLLITGGEKLASLQPPKNYRLLNIYGPSECVCYVTAYLVTKEMKNIPIGTAQPNIKTYIVDQHQHRLPVGAAGELWIAGPQVSRGYLNRPEKTAETYITNPFSQNHKYDRIYRTGDIVRYLPDGNIEFIGRRDGQVKIRGFRIELKEVEAVIREFPAVKDATVQAFDDEGGGKYIVAYVVGNEKIDIDALNNYILEQKPPYMVPAVTMQIDKIPLNQNQKVNKKALPKPEKKAEQQEPTNAPLNVLEKELHQMVASIINNEDFGLTTVLGFAGLTSISAIKLAVQLNKRFGVKLDSKAFVKTGSIQSIENEILQNILTGKQTPAPEPDDNTATGNITDLTFPLSYAQTGVYFDCLKNPNTTTYNIPFKITFPQNTDTIELAEAIKAVVALHPQLNVHFETQNGEPMQVCNPNQKTDIPIKTMTEKEVEEYLTTFVVPFNLNIEPLYQFEIISTDRHVYFLFDAHHLVFDGGSFDLFLRQLCDQMNGLTPEKEEQSYAQYVKAEKINEKSDNFTATGEFFKDKLANCESATEIPYDLAEPKNGALQQVFAAFDFNAVDNYCRNNNITPAHLTLAAVFYTLSRFANNEQLCITTISNGRSNLAIANTIGMFVNTLAISANADGKQKIGDFLKKVSKDFDETLEHENYPFAQIADTYGLVPKIQFVYQLGVINTYTCKNEKLSIESLELNVPKFPVTIFIQEENGQPGVCVDYDNGRYSQAFMQRLADAIITTLQSFIAASPDDILNTISIVNEKEEKHVIELGKGKEIDIDLSHTFANLFTEQAQRTPDAPAVVDNKSQFTYREMDTFANGLARQLIRFGVQPDDFVCVMLDRTKEFPLSVLAIHKAGAAYTPLDSEYPNERLSYMLENSNSKVLITTHEVLEMKKKEGDLNTANARVFYIDDFIKDLHDKSKNIDCSHIDLSSPDGLAYMIYTSGSTGKPKGAMLHQAGLRNLIAVVIDMEKLTADDRISGHRSFSFDAHIEDMYPILTLGGSFHIMPAHIRKDLAAIRQFLFDHHITGGGYSTAMTCLLLNTYNDLPIRFTTGGGEKMSGVYSDHIEIINVYGPTECTDDTSYYIIKPGERIDNIPIGQSVANNWNFVVDTAGHLVPQGVAGELCFAGIQVGRGYWQLPERTAQSFCDCPFVKKDHWGRHVRMYHTGDLCRWNANGQIEYLGRIDTQVKLRGFRIELGEIENKVINIPGIKQTAAEVRKIAGNEHLVLYYTLNDNAQLTADDIKKTLQGSSLAEYMVPDTYMQLDTMPMTPNGKINRKTLPTPELKRQTEYVKPENDTEKLFADIFADVLNVEQVGATDNFFDIGGTSINAIKVIVEASKHNMQLVFTDIFNLKTPRALAQYLNQQPNTAPAENKKEAGVATAPITDEQYPSYRQLLEKNNLHNFLTGERQEIGDVLLTGATGYLGIHILNELLTGYTGRILCPIRCKPNEKPANRLKTLFYYYFGRNEAFNRFDERVEAFAAEVTQPDALNNIKQQGLTVINCVANVKHFSAGNDIETVNIDSVKHLITFCLKNNARLIHISTNSIAGMSINGTPAPDTKLSEQDFYIGQDVKDNKYVYSKFIAENLIFEAIEKKNLNAKIMRVGNLSARQRDGEFQINFQTNNFLSTLRAYVVIGMVSYETLDQRFEFSPIDEVAQAILKLATTPKECIVFHPNNIHKQPLADILTGFAEAGIKLKRVENEEFLQALQQMMDNPDLVTLLRPLMAYKMSGTQNIKFIESTNDYTTQVLYRLNFQWSPTTIDYVHQFIDTIIGFDYFTV